MTATIVIGNSDNKLRQQEWSAFVDDMNDSLSDWAEAIHFFGGPNNWALWQNCCWVIELKIEDKSDFLEDIKSIRENYNQESVAVIFGETEFI